MLIESLWFQMSAASLVGLLLFLKIFVPIGGRIITQQNLPLTHLKGRVLFGVEILAVWAAIIIALWRTFPETFASFYSQQDLFFGLPIALLTSGTLFYEKKILHVLGGITILCLWIGAFLLYVFSGKTEIEVRPGIFSNTIPINSPIEWTISGCIVIKHDKGTSQECPGEKIPVIETSSVAFSSATDKTVKVIIKNK